MPAPIWTRDRSPLGRKQRKRRMGFDSQKEKQRAEEEDGEILGVSRISARKRGMQKKCERPKGTRGRAELKKEKAELWRRGDGTNFSNTMRGMTRRPLGRQKSTSGRSPVEWREDEYKPVSRKTAETHTEEGE